MNPSIIGISETNRCWKHIPDNHRWEERTKGWWESSKSCISYNYKDCNTSSYQPGGNILLSIGKATHRIIKQGVDETGLGRWSWTRYRGKRNITLRVICAYRPCRPYTAGINSAYSQHQRIFNVTNDTRCPRNAILEDLEEKIIKWRDEEGDQIILMMDCNENVDSPHIQQWLTNCGLYNMTNDTAGLQVPATQHRGSFPIDGIFLSNTLYPVRKGY